MFLVSVCFVSFWYQDHLYSVYAGLVGLGYPNPHKHSKRNHLFWYQGCTTCLYSWKSRWFWCQKSTAHAYTQNVKKNNLIYKSVPPISYRFQNHCFIFLFFLGICTCMCYALLASKSLICLSIFKFLEPQVPETYQKLKHSEKDQKGNQRVCEISLENQLDNWMMVFTYTY